MATPFMQKRMELGMPIPADALDASATKDELLAEAKSAEVDGAASMSKAELADEDPAAADRLAPVVAALARLGGGRGPGLHMGPPAGIVDGRPETEVSRCRRRTPPK